MRSWLWCAVGVMAGSCGFNGAQPGDDGDDGDDTPMIDAPMGTPDAPVDAPPGTPDAPVDARLPDAMPTGLDVAHLSAATEAMFTNTSDVISNQPRTIDTTAGTITPAFTQSALILPDVAQEGGGPNVMVV